MLLSWIIKTVPRSPRAFLALLVMIGSISLAFSALLQLFVPGNSSTSRLVIQFVVSLAIGLPATAAFYYFQTIDSRRQHDRRTSELEILNKYVESEGSQRVYTSNKATAVFNSQTGASEPAVKQPKI